jgi:hypothetical protein
MIHMFDQIRALGPLYLHEMWTYERFISILNRYMLNRTHPEESMIESCLFQSCLGYLNDNVFLGLSIA